MGWVLSFQLILLLIVFAMYWVGLQDKPFLSKVPDVSLLKVYKTLS